MTEKNPPLSHEVVCVQMVDFETPSSKSEVWKSNSWKITSFLQTMALQREPFLTMFYTINLSPLLVTKKGLMLIIILSNYQQCPLPLTGRYMFGNYQRSVFSLAVSQHKHKITSLSKFELNRSLKLREKTPLLEEFVCFQIRIKDFQLEVFYCLPLSQKPQYFRGSRFPQCFILPTPPKCLLPSQFLS